LFSVAILIRQKWLRYALRLAVQEKLLTASPMEGLRIKQTDPRQVVVYEEEVTRLEEYFVSIGRPCLALGVRFAYDTGQRSADIIKFPWSRWDRGDVLIRQQKTKAVVRVKALPKLVAAINRAEAEVISNKQKGTIVLVNEETGKPWEDSNFSHRINDGFRELGLIDEETGKAKVFRDLRRSAVVRLGQAGCTAFEIGSATGHSYTRIEQILETYLPRSTPMARAAIERLLTARRASSA
jgi:integrase